MGRGLFTTPLSCLFFVICISILSIVWEIFEPFFGDWIHRWRPQRHTYQTHFPSGSCSFWNYTWKVSSNAIMRPLVSFTSTPKTTKIQPANHTSCVWYCVTTQLDLSIIIPGEQCCLDCHFHFALFETQQSNVMIDGSALTTTPLF